MSSDTIEDRLNAIRTRKEHIARYNELINQERLIVNDHYDTIAEDILNGVESTGDPIKDMCLRDCRREWEHYYEALAYLQKQVEAHRLDIMAVYWTHSALVKHVFMGESEYADEYEMIVGIVDEEGMMSLERNFITFPTLAYCFTGQGGPQSLRPELREWKMDHLVSLQIETLSRPVEHPEYGRSGVLFGEDSVRKFVDVGFPFTKEGVNNILRELHVFKVRRS